MSTTLYELSVASYLQSVGAVRKVLKKGGEQAAAAGQDVDELVQLRLHDTMLPMSFQIVSVVHHSLGAVKGLRAGEFGPPSGYPAELDFAGWQAFLDDAHTELQAIDADEINGLAGKAVHFRMGSVEIPFTAENFVMSFSLPNLYFHATTTYDLLRMHAVKLGKADYLGWLRKGLPA
ncbi:MAG: DUF1993 domain-containing protein [Pseudomonadota bacterium]